MKTLIALVAGLLLVGGVILYSTQKSKRSPDTNTVSAAPGSTAEPTSPAETGRSDSSAQRAREPRVVSSPAAVDRRPSTMSSPAAGSSLPFQQALNTVTSPKASFAQRQASWQQLRESGNLDLSIAEIEKLAASDSTAPEFPAALGQAYLQKAGTLTDLREQGILGLKADQCFDAALNLDASNWDAAFWKVTAMSYWPPQLGKGPEVLQRLVDLVQLQEAQQTQPQFVQTYLLLGEQYQKQGYAEHAKQAWERGAALFPNEPRLVEKLGAGQPAQTAAR